jgi:hypothetical protein
LNLPTELILDIAELLPLEALKSLSAANRQFREILEPSLFSRIKSTSHEYDSDRILCTIQKQGRHVNKLVFEHHFLPLEQDAVSPADASRAGTEKYHAALQRPYRLTELARQLLNGRLLPNVSHMKIIS